jgi:hypothetical protein
VQFPLGQYKFGNSWIFSSELLIEAVKQLSRAEADRRRKPTQPFGVQVATASSRRRPLPGLNLLPEEVRNEILKGRSD